jgi:hypothetical protein
VTVSFGGNGRPLAINRGTLAGYGTFAMASSLYIGGSANGNTVLMPGDSSSPSTLNFTFTEGTKLVLDSGGTYFWQVMDAKSWYGSVNVTGTVEIAATSATPFEIVLNAGGGSGPNSKDVSALSSNSLLTNFDIHSQYSWRILTADAINGFDPGKFTIQLDNSFGDGIGNFNFSLALGDNGTSLLLNFDPAAVPEPSTWVLLLAGLGVVGFAAWRRRRA